MEWLYLRMTFVTLRSRLRLTTGYNNCKVCVCQSCLAMGKAVRVSVWQPATFRYVQCGAALP